MEAVRTLRYRLARWLRWDRLWGARWFWLTDGDELSAKIHGIYAPRIIEAVFRKSPLFELMKER